MFWIVGQHSLHDVRLEFLDQAVERASLFPFFDGEGTTRELMLTARDSSDILLFPYQPGRLRQRLFRPYRIALRRADLRDGSFEDAQRLATLWHFDPWWELAEPRYAHHSAVPTLRSTNVVGFRETFDRIWFDSQLSRVRLTATGAGEETKVKRFSPGLLAKAHHQRSQQSSQPAAFAEPSSEWKLSPFWQAANHAGGPSVIRFRKWRK